jgi:Alw26I/Eco31I/Esp3I family type II restriction m6 adenine DNA methyltransferase
MINFSDKYNRKKIQLFLNEFLPKDYIETENELKIDESNSFFQNATLLGSVKSLEGLVIIELERIKSEKSRITITRELFKFLEIYGYSKALVITFSQKESHYRFSLVKSELKWASETKVKKIFSNPKRLSFLLGVGSKVHTATKHLIDQGRVKDFEDLYGRFNIEIVNDEFYEHYKNLYLNLTSKLDNDNEFSTFAKKISLETNNFAKKLLGQIIFCYFLQKKGWLGVDKNKSFGTGDNSFLRNQFTKYENENKNFFNEFLEFFFYQGLNNQNENDFVKKIDCRVPYIGGGLFEYYEGYDWQKESLKIPNTTFSNPEKNGILDIFELYNFTVDENETIDIEISIDPEMLGRIFESLLEENIRQKRGAFYTPRNIVKEMCEKSIINYLNIKLKNKLTIQQIFSFVSDETFDPSKDKDVKGNAALIDLALEEIKICDPAIGSGAFAVGIVNLISKLRVNLKYFLDRKYKNTSYYFKRDCIQNSIYGVDIDISAVEIAKLRLWLSLIVDEADYASTEPLPNLDYKIMQGDSLIDEFYGYKFSINQKDKKQYSLDENPNEIEELVTKLNLLQKKYLNLKQFLKRKEIKIEVEKLLVEIFEKVMSSLDRFDKEKSKEFKISYKNKIYNNQKKDFFCWELFFADVFYLKKGFDVIIANPPYEVLDSKKTSAERIAQLRKNDIYKPAAEGQLNYFKLFLAKFLTHLNEDGVAAFIFPNAFIGDKTCTKIRKFVFDQNKLISLASYPECDDANRRVFKSAKVSVCIAHMSKKISQDYIFDLDVWQDKEKKRGFSNTFNKKFIQKDLYYRIPSLDKDGLKIYQKMINNPNVIQLQNIGKVFSGELDMTIHKKFFSEKKNEKYSSPILKGANIQSFYTTNDVSQGKNEFLDVKSFLKDNKSNRSSSFQFDRIAMQGISSVPMKYRLVSSLVKKNCFLANSTNFIIKTSDDFTNNEIVVYLNSNLLNWFFKIFSTNVNVSTYEINILPLLRFSKKDSIKINQMFKEFDKSNILNFKNDLNAIVYNTFKLNEKEIEYINSYF